MLSVSGDFNGDGLQDLAIGIPGKNIGRFVDAGQVSVLYGAVDEGLTTQRNQLWDLNRPGVRGVVRSFDLFGSSLVAGDFDGDGYDDLAIGAPGKKIDGQSGAGAVIVLYGTVNGLTGTGSQFWTADDIPVGDGVQKDATFGAALTAGDFNADGYDDLAIGSPWQNRGSSTNVGAAYVLYGSATGVDDFNAQIWSQKTTNIVGTTQRNARFGAAMTVGDFNGDGYDDLGIGAPDHRRLGTTNVIYGNNIRLTTAGNQFFKYGGSALASGDFDGDQYDDLAIGQANLILPGAVTIMYGDEDGLPTRTRESITLKDFGIDAPRGSGFGYSLTAGNYDGDRYDDLAIGAPFAPANNVDEAGLVQVMYGSRLGLRVSDSQQFDQGPGISGVSHTGDLFGLSVVTGDYNGDGYFDLAIGVPGEDVGSLVDVGIVHVIYGSDDGLTKSKQQLWRFGLPGMLGHANSLDGFGWSLG